MLLQEMYPEIIHAVVEGPISRAINNVTKPKENQLQQPDQAVPTLNKGHADPLHLEAMRPLPEMNLAEMSTEEIKSLAEIKSLVETRRAKKRPSTVNTTADVSIILNKLETALSPLIINLLRPGITTSQRPNQVALLSHPIKRISRKYAFTSRLGCKAQPTC